MRFRTKTVALVVLLALTAFALGACGDGSDDETTTTSGGTTVSSLPLSTTTSQEHLGAGATFKAVGDVVKVEQGELSVSKITVTDNITSDAANALLYTGEAGEGKNVSKAAASGNEFLLITFMFKKAAYYDFEGGVDPTDIILKNATGIEYELVETAGNGGLFDSKPGKVKPDVEAFVTAAYEVPEGETGLVLVYHRAYEDGFSVNLR
ncbi:MAG: hypothetical protein A2133_07855 [Actinobacteria bacterium RBG_16_64_13]|nr:MAG: hypothetical protein A2133_07855 [Actinobacteria bacterium RBG_16_64_13]